MHRLERLQVLLAEVAATQIRLYLFQVSDDLCNALVSQVLFRILGQHLDLKVIEYLFDLYLWFLALLGLLGDPRCHTSLDCRGDFAAELV